MYGYHALLFICAFLCWLCTLNSLGQITYTSKPSINVEVIQFLSLESCST